MKKLAMAADAKRKNNVSMHTRVSTRKKEMTYEPQPAGRTTNERAHRIPAIAGERSERKLVCFARDGGDEGERRDRKIPPTCWNDIE